MKTRNRASARKPSIPAHALRARLEALEDRTVPTTMSVADVTVREGPANLGALDPAGAARVGINGTRGITFDTRPTDAHYGDLFVTGYLSHSVARFDWATQTYQPFVTPNSGGLALADSIAVGPDGNVYVGDNSQNIVFRFDGETGTPLPAPGQTGAVFVNAGSNGANNTSEFAFGPDGNVYVGDNSSNRILEYQGPAGPSPGAFMRVFATVNTDIPVTVVGNPVFGPDGNLYVCAFTSSPKYGQIYRFDGATGAPLPGPGQTGAVFVPYGSGGLINARTIIFDPQGMNMYVAAPEIGSAFPSVGQPIGQVLRYQGPNGQNPGAYVEAYLPVGQAGLNIAIGIARDAAGNLYVSDRDTANVTRIAPASQATFTVTLSSPSAGPVSVAFATANGTAVAGTDYTQTSGTLTFPAGVTSATVSVPITTVATGGPTKTFTLNLSGASGATIGRGQAAGSILNRQTKFFVVDSGTARTYEYGSGGTSEEITVPQLSSNTAPRGAATTAAGNKVWVADANRTVYVYSNHGVLLGSWTAGGLNPNAQLEGIATNGTDVWLLDNFSDKVYKYAGAASRLSGGQTAVSSFSLNSGNSNGKGIVTDGTSLWVVNDASTDKVFKYTLAGSLLGSWTIDAANASPTGLTIDPANVSDIWIVDNGTDKVYQYAAAASRTSGSQTATATFALAAGNTNPQDIADPPPSFSVGDATVAEGSAALKLLDHFVPDGSGGLTAPNRNSAFGPDGNNDGAQDLYVASAGSNAILRYDGVTGSFIDTFVPSASGGLTSPADLAFGPDGSLYVTSLTTNQVLRYNGSSGAFLNVAADGLAGPLGITFGQDGSLYIANTNANQVLRLSNVGLSVFVTAGSGGLALPRKAVFGPDGNGDGVQDLYVASSTNGRVLRYDGQTGAFIDTFAAVTSTQGPLLWLAFGTDGLLYTTVRTNPPGTVTGPPASYTTYDRFNATTGAFVDRLDLGRDGWAFIIGSENVVYNSSLAFSQPNVPATGIDRFGPSSLVAFTVSLDSTSPTPVSVTYATANGTALAGSDYVAASGTLTFAPGQTTRTVLVRTLDDALYEGVEAFAVNLSNPVGATVADGQGVGTIRDNEPQLPRVASVSVNDGTGTQRSRVTSLTVTFDDYVTFANGDVAAAFGLSRIGGEAVGGFTATLSNHSGTSVVTLTDFTGAEAQFGSLADGRYRLTVRADRVSLGGRPLDGDGDGLGGDDYTLAGTAANGLYRLYGDANGDGFVNAFDFAQFRGAFGTSAGQAGYLDFLDLDGDGFVNAFDFAQFRTRFGSSVP